MKTLLEIQERYNLELDRIVKEVKVSKSKSVLLQLPDGMKQYATLILDYLEEKTGAQFKIYLGSCFGACDLPDSDADLVVQFGHAPWR